MVALLFGVIVSTPFKIQHFYRLFELFIVIPVLVSNEICRNRRLAALKSMRLDQYADHRLDSNFWLHLDSNLLLPICSDVYQTYFDSIFISSLKLTVMTSLTTSIRIVVSPPSPGGSSSFPVHHG